MDWLLLAWAGVMLAAGGIGVVTYLRHRYVFVVELTPEGARVLRGEAPKVFVSACTDVARLQGLQQGRVYGVRERDGAGLRFSRDIPEPARQAFRNCWMHPPTPPPSGSGMRRAG